ncbi:MAG: hypothetical protein LBC61_07320 [Candidatus Peribacteria bacterium]|nr:hypothetical protein [Candidatus Peribacteria bacterium]
MFRLNFHSALQGRSAIILSNSFKSKLSTFNLIASVFIIFTFSAHCLLIVNFNLSILIALLSTAIISQVFCSFAAT